MSRTDRGTTPGLRIVFAGTPAFAAAILQSLIADFTYSVVAVYTQPDRPAGRGKRLSASPVKLLAESHGVAVKQPISFKHEDSQAELAALTPDLLVVAAYGLILPSTVLTIPRYGCINVHASLLPRWRGAAPVERAIEAGDSETGVTIMQMDEGLDTGDMLLKQACPISEKDTGDSLRDRLAQLGAVALSETLVRLREGSLQRVAQNDAQAVYARKLQRCETDIDWSEPADVLARKIRAFHSSNVCQTVVDGQTLRIWYAIAESDAPAATPGTVLEIGRGGIRVACGKGSLRLTRLQLPGGKPLDASALLNGRPKLLQSGTRLGDICAI